jgi:hypothetical protein
MNPAFRTLVFSLCLIVTLHVDFALSQNLTCTSPQKPMLDIELLLGRAGGDLKWRTFLVREVTPRFPDGLTVYETTGQWRDPATKVITRERSRVLRIIASADTAPDKIAAVAETYKKQFGQKSVGIVTRQVCASF